MFDRRKRRSAGQRLIVLSGATGASVFENGIDTGRRFVLWAEIAFGFCRVRSDELEFVIGIRSRKLLGLELGANTIVTIPITANQSDQVERILAERDVRPPSNLAELSSTQIFQPESNDLRSPANDEPVGMDGDVTRPFARTEDIRHIAIAFAPFVALSLVAGAVWFVAARFIRVNGDDDKWDYLVAQFVVFVALVVALSVVKFCSLIHDYFRRPVRAKETIGDDNRGHVPSTLRILMENSPALILGILGIVISFRWIQWHGMINEFFKTTSRAILRPRRAERVGDLLGLIHSQPTWMASIMGLVAAIFVGSYLHSLWLGFHRLAPLRDHDESNR